MEHTGGIVVAGSRPFVRALTGAFRQRRRVVVGITGELEPTFVLANASRGLLVLEYDGAQRLPVLSTLLGPARRAGLRIIAVLPPGLEPAAEGLVQAGVDAVVPWVEATPELVVSGAESLLELAERTPLPLPLEPEPPRDATAQPVRWDPRQRMAPLARVVDPPPSPWRRVGTVLGSLFALAALATLLYGVAG